jgi:hypothetical protein
MDGVIRMKTSGPQSNWKSAEGLAGALSMTRLVKMARQPGQPLSERDRQFDKFAKFLAQQFKAACAKERLTKDEVANLLADIEDRVAEARADIAERN